MADAMLSQTQLKLIFEIGVDENGKPKFRSRTFNNVKKTATADELFTTATALASLSSYLLDSIQRNDSYDIVE